MYRFFYILIKLVLNKKANYDIYARFLNFILSDILNNSHYYKV